MKCTLTAIFLIVHAILFSQDINFPKEEYRQYELDVTTYLKMIV